MALTKVNASNIVDGVLPVANGGTGATTQAGAAAAVLPSQTGQSGKYLATDGTNTSWDQINISTADITGTLPVANGGTGQTTANAGFNALAPSQSGNSGKYLTTDGTNTSWGTVTAPTPAAVSDQNNTSTGYFDLPAGTTAQRPASPANGMTRFNTTLGYPEWYSETYSTWVPFYDAGPYSVEYLIVAGGGGGGARHAGGGGAGGMLTGTTTVTPNVNYSMVIGGGGSAGIPSTALATNGSNSSALSLTSIGGGAGGQYAENSFRRDNGNSGGSGGGGANNVGTAGSGGAGTSGQGNSGGSVTGGSGDPWAGAGGGGKGSTGGNAPNTSTAGGGGAGAQWSDGSYYAGGGGGGGNNSSGTGGAGGIGGGGNGGGGTGGQTGTAGTSNTGGGGGGSRDNTGGAGGSGVVIVRYLGSQRGSGGTVTSSGGYTYHTFTTSGTFTG